MDKDENKQQGVVPAIIIGGATRDVQIDDCKFFGHQQIADIQASEHGAPSDIRISRVESFAVPAQIPEKKPWYRETGIQIAAGLVLLGAAALLKYFGIDT